jgi:hypothetical protein
MDGWMGGWMDGWESRVKDCLQQSKITEIFNKPRHKVTTFKLWGAHTFGNTFFGIL